MPEGQYEGIKRKAEKGEFTLIDPLDYIILDALHEEGEMFAGIYPLGSTVKQIAQGTFKGQVPTNVLGPRFNSMSFQGLIVSSMGVGVQGKKIWQRTPLGKKVVEEWKSKKKEVSGG